MAGPAITGTGAVRDLRAHRRLRRLGRLEWFDIAYKAYLVLLFGGGAVLWLTGLVGDQPLVDELAEVVEHGPAAVALVAAVAVAVGLRGGSRGGPLALEAADVAHLLTAPLSRRAVLLVPAGQRLRTAVLAGVGTGAVVGRLAAQRLPGSPWTWTASVAASGALVGALWMGSALVAHRRHRAITSLVGAVLIGWEAAGLVTEIPSPLRGVGALALSPLPGGGPSPWWIVVSTSVAVILLAIGVSLLERVSVEALERRSALVGQLRFAATMQDLRTVVLLRRQLDEEHPRSVPWVRLAVQPETVAGSISRTVWRRDVRGLLRLPLTRLLRMALLAVLWGVSIALTLRGTTPALVVAGLAGFVLGLEAIEPLSQEVDHADRCDLLPVERGDLMVRHLLAPAALLAPFGAIGGAVAVLVGGDPWALAAPMAVLAVPAIWAAAAGAVVSAVRDAPDPVAASSGPTPIAMPEVTGLGTAVRSALPLAVSCLAAATVLFVRAAVASSGSVLGASLRGAAAALVLVFLTSQWVRLRDRARRSANRFLAEGRAASRLGAGVR